MSVRSSWLGQGHAQVTGAVVFTLYTPTTPAPTRARLVAERKQNSLNKRTIVLTKN